LTREYVTSVIRDRFTRESDRLKLERVTLVDVAGKKGTLQHQPAFVGVVSRPHCPGFLAKASKQPLAWRFFGGTP
jgi:hypothetical protein